MEQLRNSATIPATFRPPYLSRRRFRRVDSNGNSLEDVFGSEPMASEADIPNIRRVKNFADMIISNITFVILLTVIVPILTVNLLLRRIISVYLYLMKPNKERLLGPTDAQFVHDITTNTFLHVFVLQGKPCVYRLSERILSLVYQRDRKGNLKFEKMTKIIRKRFGYITTQHAEKIDLNNHLKTSQVSRSSCDTEFNRFVADAANTELELNKPLWEIYVVSEFPENCNENKYAVIFKMHRSVMDKETAFKFAEAALGFDESVLLNSENFCNHRASLTWKTYAKRFLSCLIFAPWTLRTWHRQDHYRFMNQDKIGKRKILRNSRLISIAEAKRVCENVGTNIPSLLLASLTNSMKSFVERKNGYKLIPKHIFSSISLKENFSRKKSSQSFLFVKVPLSKTELRQRLYEIDEYFEAVTADAEIIASQFLYSILGSLPSWGFKRFSRRFIGAACHTVVFKAPLSLPSLLHSDRLRNYYFVNMDDRHTGLSFSFVNLGDNVRLSVAASENMPQGSKFMEQFIMDFEQEISNILSTS